MTSQVGALEQQMEHLMEAHAEEVKRYRAGKKKLAGFFVGKLMREFNGKADPGEVQSVVRKMLATQPDKQ
jgi:aspartyl-tRNA(Asn)/glutamyl-tRNA(Gln) amidotransferase subunit B